MSDGTSIEWLAWPGYRPASWNPTSGCSRVSEGCRNCYAEVMAARFSKPGQWGHGIAEMRGGYHRWTGRVELDDAKMLLPLRWRKPRCIFVNSTSDLFHERLPDDTIDRVFAVMALCPQHRLIVLTKRAERMNQYMAGRRWCAVFDAAERMGGSVSGVWPLPNVILGVSVEDQATADERIPHLLSTPAACRMVSAEPLLGPINFRKLRSGSAIIDALSGDHWNDSGERVASGQLRLNWIVSGAESGPRARTMRVEWVRSIVQQCKNAEVPCFVKQIGPSPIMDEIDAVQAVALGAGWDRLRQPYGRTPDNRLGFVRLRNRKGADMEEWPSDLRVREVVYAT